MEKKNRIILFWTITILGLLAHSLADALPAFWGQGIATRQGPAPVGMMTFNPVQLLIMPMMFVLALLMAIDSVPGNRPGIGFRILHEARDDGAGRGVWVTCNLVGKLRHGLKKSV